MKALTLDADERDRQIELLDYQIKELTDAEIKVGEWDELKKRKNLILNSQNLLQSLNSALAAFNGSDDYSGISTLLSTAVKELGTVSDVDGDIKAVYDKAEALNDSVEVVKDALLDKINSIEFDLKNLTGLKNGSIYIILFQISMAKPNKICYTILMKLLKSVPHLKIRKKNLKNLMFGMTRFLIKQLHLHKNLPI